MSGRDKKKKKRGRIKEQGVVMGRVIGKAFDEVTFEQRPA